MVTPGVYSARYAGNKKRDEDNIYKLLKELRNKDNTKAQFRTVIALIYNHKEFIFERENLLKENDEIKGDNGFGYDPIFQLEHHLLSLS